MTEIDHHSQLHQSAVRNQQLFSEVYLQELRATPVQLDHVRAVFETIRDWHEEYPLLTHRTQRVEYLSQCLSALGFAYTFNDPFFTLYADITHQQALGMVLLTEEEDLGLTFKGRHPQAQLVIALCHAGLKWGLVTNGERWRLCHAAATAPYEVYLDTNLTLLLCHRNLEEFTLFYHFSALSSFVLSDDPANCQLDRYLEKSEKRVEVIQRYLRSQVEEVAGALCMGFVQDENAGYYSREKLDEIYLNSIHLLFRILFLFYAEARELLPVANPRYRMVGMPAIMELARCYQEGQTPEDAYAIWRTLLDLCGFVDLGKAEYDISAYNGGLFSDEKHPYFKEHRMRGEFLARALYRLAFIPAKSRSLDINYCDVSVRQLGTLYEGLLEYRLNLVSEEPVVVRENGGKRQFVRRSEAGGIRRGETVLEIGQVYFADDKGERKSSGSYYTPEDVVQYIVGQAVLPRLHERRAALESYLKEELNPALAMAVSSDERVRLQALADAEILRTVEEQLLTLRILDPAMGSGHFLVAAGQTVANFIVETLNLTDWANENLSSDPLFWKRRVVERCLFGVDLNPLTQELAKLALWIMSASAGKPLTFLDHHLKIGNSLYGTSVARLSILPTARAKKGQPSKTLFDVMREGIIGQALERLRAIMSTDSDRMEDVKRKEEEYRNATEITARLRDISNYWLATLFEELGDTDYEKLLEYVTTNYDSEQWQSYVVQSEPVLRQAHELAERERFFHWELEFPDAVVGDTCRFDIIIANPPYVGTSPNRVVNALYQTARCGDIYAWILERVLRFLSPGGYLGVIVPFSIMFSGDKQTLREAILKKGAEVKLISFDNNPDTIFKTFGSGPNSQRATIVILRDTDSESKFFTSNLLRWSSEDRQFLFSNIPLAETTDACSREVFPRIGTTFLTAFWLKLRSMKNRIRNIAKEIFSESKRPDINTLCLTVPRSARNFVSATPGLLMRNKVLTLSFDNQDDLDLCQVLINSNVFYWYWRVFGDGFLLNVDLLSSFPVPDKTDLGFRELAVALNEAMPECTIYSTFRGERIISYNYNKKLELLYEIDSWLVKQVAPEMRLSNDIFGQYKSNSYLRPFEVVLKSTNSTYFEGD